MSRLFRGARHLCIVPSGGALAAAGLLALLGCGDDELRHGEGGGGGASTASTTSTTSTSSTTSSGGEGGAGGDGGGTTSSTGGGGSGGESACPALAPGDTSLFFESVAVHGLVADVPTPAALGGVARTRLTLELYEDGGLLPPLEPGTFDLTEPPNDDYGTCQHCVLLVAYDEDDVPVRAFFQASGEMTLDHLEWPYVVAGSTTEVELREVRQLPDGSWEPLPDGACFTAPPWDFDTRPVDGAPCGRVEQCPNEAYQVCDPVSATCVAYQCDLTFHEPFCDEGELCFSQLVDFGDEPFGPPAGACYAQCDPARPDCGEGATCRPLGPTQEIGVCLALGDGELGAACPGSDVSTDCVEGATCDGGSCAALCTYLSDPSGCGAGTHCAVDNVCRPAIGGDPAAVGEECEDQGALLGDCGAEGDAFRGLCLNFFLQDPLVCERTCRTEDPACPAGEQCLGVFSNPAVGICRPLPVCGDALLDVIGGEVCDDGNVEDGDGCSADCGEADVAALCGSARELRLDGPNVGTNLGGPSGYVSSCDPFVVMPTDTFAFAPPAPGTLVLDVTSADPSHAFGVSVLEDCTAEAEIGCQVPVTDAVEIEIAEVSAEPLLVVVRGETPTTVGAFVVSASFRIAVCGDGDVSGPEACDDGNEEDGDGCSADCLAIEWEDVCAALPELPLDEPIESSTEGGTQFFDTGGMCATAAGGGRERAFTFTAPAEGFLTVTVTQPRDDFAVWIGDGCGAPSWEGFVGCGNSGWVGEDEVAMGYLLEGQEVTVVVEGMRGGDDGAFTISASFEPI